MIESAALTPVAKITDEYGIAMHNLDRIKTEFSKVLADFEGSTAMMKILLGSMTVAHYKSYLRQTYHYTKDNPQIQALATVYFRGTDRQFINMFYKHAISEIGHDEANLRAATSPFLSSYLKWKQSNYSHPKLELVSNAKVWLKQHF